MELEASNYVTSNCDVYFHLFMSFMCRFLEIMVSKSIKISTQN